MDVLERWRALPEEDRAGVLRLATVPTSETWSAASAVLRAVSAGELLTKNAARAAILEETARFPGDDSDVTDVELALARVAGRLALGLEGEEKTDG